MMPIGLNAISSDYRSNFKSGEPLPLEAIDQHNNDPTTYDILLLSCLTNKLRYSMLPPRDRLPYGIIIIISNTNIKTNSLKCPLHVLILQVDIGRKCKYWSGNIQDTLLISGQNYKNLYKNRCLLW
jgi:hypothetical protein